MQVNYAMILLTNGFFQGIIIVQSAVFGVRYKTGSTLYNRELGVLLARQGLYYGKSDTTRQSTHLLKAGSSFCRGAAQADYFVKPTLPILRQGFLLAKKG